MVVAHSFKVQYPIFQWVINSFIPEAVMPLTSPYILIWMSSTFTYFSTNTTYQPDTGTLYQWSIQKFIVVFKTNFFHYTVTVT